MIWADKFVFSFFFFAELWGTRENWYQVQGELRGGKRGEFMSVFGGCGGVWSEKQTLEMEKCIRLVWFFALFSRLRTQTWRKSSKILMYDRIYLPGFRLSCFLIKNFSVLICKVELCASTSLTTLWSAFKIPNSWLKTSFLFALGYTLCPWEASYRVCKQARP